MTVGAASLADEYWEGTLRASPRFATSIGDRRYDDRMEDPSPGAAAAEEARLRGLLRRVSAEDPARLSPADRVTQECLRVQIESDLDGIACGLDEWTVDPLGGPQVDLLNLPDIQPIRTPAEGSAYAARIRAMGPYLDAASANLRRGLAKGLAATRSAVSKSAAELKDLLARPVEEDPLSAPAREAREGWPAADRDAFAEAVRSAVAGSVRPAFTRLRALVEGEILPRARPPGRAGLVHLPGGAEAYRRLVRIHTSLDLDPGAVHRAGLSEVARIRAEMEALGARALGARGVADLKARLRADPAMSFSSREEVFRKAEEALRRAEAEVPRWFGIRPGAPCAVKAMGPHEERFSTIAYYRPPAEDGSRPGTFHVNTSEPATRPRYDAEALAFHEAVPGHHLQISIAQERREMPAFRRHMGVTAFVEGWALYAERLSDEMGLYGSDLDRIGMLSYDAWRAGRLVVDTGLHALGWSRGQAIEFLRGNALLSDNNVENEVDRYIVWPAQALAYKTGEMEIRRLRDGAAGALGAAFDIRAFHDRLLEAGAVPLGILRRRVEEWIAAARTR